MVFKVLYPDQKNQHYWELLRYANYQAPPRSFSESEISRVESSSLFLKVLQMFLLSTSRSTGLINPKTPDVFHLKEIDAF